MASDTKPKVCLDVAIDHRIRRLFKPVSVNLPEHSNHVSRIEARGRVLKRSRREIQVTAQLAGPAVKGGIAITLQQPRRNHPFEEGLDVVIDDCGTLYALYDIFTAVSCGTLDIRTDITIVDLLPYESEALAEIGDTKLRKSFSTLAQVICDKEPDVVLCAGKIWLPNAGKFDDRKGDARKLESIGLGKTFGTTAKYPVTAKICSEGRAFVAIPRVNGFHPSCAMNHYPHVSILRQLQILIGAETCGMLRGDWEEEEWMDELRSRCQKISRSYSDIQEASPSKSPPLQSPGQSSTRRNSVRYLPDYQELYSSALLGLQNRANPLISDPRLAKKPPGELYRTVFSGGVGELCNDAALILRQMFRLQDRNWPDSVAWKNKAALQKAASDTVQFAETMLKATTQGNDTDLAKIIQRGARSILEHVTDGSAKQPGYELDMSGAGDAFVELATKIEALLLDLLLKKEEALNALGQEEALSSMMNQMNLAGAPAAVAPVPLSLPASVEYSRKFCYRP